MHAVYARRAGLTLYAGGAMLMRRFDAVCRRRDADDPAGRGVAEGRTARLHEQPDDVCLDVPEPAQLPQHLRLQHSDQLRLQHRRLQVSP